MCVYVDVFREITVVHFSTHLESFPFYNQSVFLYPRFVGLRKTCLSRSTESQVIRVCGVLRDPLTHKHPVRQSSPMSAPPESHPSTPTAPRVSAEPEESIYPSPQHPRSPQTEDADLRLIQARHSQGRPLPPPQTDLRDPASPEEDEQWYSDPGASVDRGGWGDPKPRSHETPKQTAPPTTTTPQTAPLQEQPPSPKPTPIPT